MTCLSNFQFGDTIFSIICPIFVGPHVANWPRYVNLKNQQFPRSIFTFWLFQFPSILKTSNFLETYSLFLSFLKDSRDIFQRDIVRFLWLFFPCLQSLPSKQWVWILNYENLIKQRNISCLVSKIIKGFMPQSAFIFNIIFHGMVQIEAEISHDNRIWID